ncbi:MAG: NAD(P)H-dependent oxidoreductase [Firmicutes bacterium]|nr:NAD(P)H-dependent oxidoreductase [Bacillota bacterium]
MKKRLSGLLIAMALLLLLTACGSTGNSDNENSSQQNKESVQAAESKGAYDAGKADDADKNVIVVYFSWSGHLDSMAHWVADETDGDLFRVTAKEDYPEDYNETADRAKSEQDNGVRPEINIDLTQEQMAKYDTVFLGFPVWWYDLPMPMWTFLESYDFSGKIIIPFFSHEGSSNGANALPTVEALANGADFRKDDALSIRGGKVDSSENDVREWVRSLDY